MVDIKDDQKSNRNLSSEVDYGSNNLHLGIKERIKDMNKNE